MNVDRFEKGPREILNPEIQKVPTHTYQSTLHVLCSVNYRLFLLWFVVLLHNYFRIQTQTLSELPLLQRAWLLWKCVPLIKGLCQWHSDT